MASISVRNLSDEVRDRLRLMAASHGRSMEEEVRSILTAAVKQSATSDNLFVSLVERFGAIGGVELELPRRSTPTRGAQLD